MKYETSETIAGPAGTIEVQTSYLEESHPPSALAILCHPHPLMGGSMHHKILTTLVKVYHHFHIPSIRFNFRGVGKSTGQFDQGRGETEDLKAILLWAHQLYPNARLHLAGFSFGAYISLKILQVPFVKDLPFIDSLLSVAPPVQYPEFKAFSAPLCKNWFLVYAKDDEVVSYLEVEHWMNALDKQPKSVCFEQASHFFHSKLIELHNNLLQILNI